MNTNECLYNIYKENCILLRHMNSLSMDNTYDILSRSEIITRVDRIMNDNTRIITHIINNNTVNTANTENIENDGLYVKDMDLTRDVTITLNFYTKKLERNYLFPGNEHPIKDDRYNVSKALNDDTELLIQQNKQIGMLGLITTCVLGVGLYVLSRK